MTTTKLDVLKNMHAFYDGHPERHTTGWFARDAQGENVEADNPTAINYCLQGNIQRALVFDFKVGGFDFYEILDPVGERLDEAAGELYLEANYIKVQDDQGYEGAMKILERAIELEEAACAVSA